jgi:beta-glucosidase
MHKRTKQRILRRCLICTLLLFSVISRGQLLPYKNPNLSSAERAKDLISRLTLAEKAALMCDQSDAVPRLGIKKFNWWSEALHGLANTDNVTVFPEPVGMAASFNDALLYNIYSAVSDETRAKYNEAIQKGQENKRFLSLSVWTPNVNIFRDPRWGRGQETYGEDPYLTSRMGVQVVKGLQGPADAKYRKLLACAKHYAVHSGPEWSRHSLNLNNVNPRDLWETYLPAFKSLVQDADVRQVMCAYQRLDDEPCCGNNRLLQQILRDDWDTNIWSCRIAALLPTSLPVIKYRRMRYMRLQKVFWPEPMWSVSGKIIRSRRFRMVCQRG